MIYNASLDFTHNSQFGLASFYSYFGLTRSKMTIKRLLLYAKYMSDKGGAVNIFKYTNKHTINKQLIISQDKLNIEMQAAPANMRNKLKCLFFVLPDIFAIQIKRINSHKLNSQNFCRSLSLFRLFLRVFFSFVM